MNEIESATFEVTFQEGEHLACTFGESESFDVSFGAGIEKEYHGQTEIIPSSDYQTLHTTNRVLTEDIIIDPIPNCYGLITYNGSTITVS